MLGGQGASRTVEPREVFTAVGVQSVIFLVVTQCGLVNDYQRSEEHTASVFLVHETSLFLHIVANHLGRCLHGVKTQKFTVCTLIQF
jgi:hypothetical protein